MIDGHIYLDYDTVSDVLGGRFYWDEANQKMLYSTPSEVISISPDSNTYTAGGKEKTEEYPIICEKEDTVYLALEFIEQYIKGVEQTMRKLISLLDDGNNPAGCSFNFYYYHLMMQVRLYYPDVEEKIAGMFRQDYEFWRAAIQSAKDTGEIRQDVDIEDTAMLFRQVFFGLSFEQSFLRGLDIQRLARELRFVYSLLKA